MSDYTRQQLARISELDETIDAAADKGDEDFFAAVAAKDEYIDTHGIDRDRLEVTGRDVSEKVTFPPVGARVANIDIVNRDPSKNSGTVRSLNLTGSRPFAEVVMDDGRVEKCFGLVERGCGWYRPLSDQTPSIEVSPQGMVEKFQDQSKKVECMTVLLGRNQAALAERAFETYNFGVGVVVTDVSGWEYYAAGHERSREVYVNNVINVGKEIPSTRLGFTVRYDPLTGALAEAYAVDSTGSSFGCMPEGQLKKLNADSALGKEEPATSTLCVLNGSVQKYASGDWVNLFGPGLKETRCRIVIDLEKSELIAAQEWTGLKFEDVRGNRLEGLADSVIGANEAHENPADWGLDVSIEMPEWAEQLVHAGNDSSRLEETGREVSNYIEPSPSRPSGHMAYEATVEDVEIVLSSNSLAVENTDGKSLEAMANELHGNLDFDLIEQAALAGDDLDEQTDYANDEIARQLREMGILKPV